MKDGVMIILSFYGTALVIICAYHIVQKKRSKIKLGTMVAEWPARFNLFSLLGIWTYGKVAISLMLALFFVINEENTTAGILALLIFFAIAHESLLYTVVGSNGVYFNEKVVYWYSIAAYTIQKRAGFKYLALQIKLDETIIKIPLKPSEVENITNFIESNFVLDAKRTDDHRE